MDLHALFLNVIVAIVQGITEWFPISSDGHLVVVDRLLGRDPNFFFDVALHFGTLMAVFVYFGKDVTDIMQDFFKGKWKSYNGKLGWLLIVGTLPAVVFGFLLKDLVEKSYESLLITAIGFGITGAFLLIAVAYKPKNEKNLFGLTYRDALIIGCAQVAAIMPGISRSALTLSAGILLGLKIKDSAKFSFLLSIPAVFGANVLVIGNNSLPISLLVPTLVSFVVGLLAIYLLYTYAFNNLKNLQWFALYVFVLAIAVGIWSFFAS